MTFPQLETTLEDKTRNEQVLLKTQEALLTFTNELKRLKKTLLVAVGQGDSEENSNIDSIITRFVKYKEDNKKLKSILK